jgi:hypothetical protein
MSRKRLAKDTRVLHAMTSNWTGTVTEVLRNSYVRVSWDDGMSGKYHRDVLLRVHSS